MAPVVAHPHRSIHGIDMRLAQAPFANTHAELKAVDALVWRSAMAVVSETHTARLWLKARFYLFLLERSVNKLHAGLATIRQENTSRTSECGDDNRLQTEIDAMTEATRLMRRLGSTTNTAFPTLAERYSALADRFEDILEAIVIATTPAAVTELNHCVDEIHEHAAHHSGSDWRDVLARM